MAQYIKRNTYARLPTSKSLLELAGHKADQGHSTDLHLRSSQDKDFSLCIITFINHAICERDDFPLFVILGLFICLFTYFTKETSHITSK